MADNFTHTLDSGNSAFRSVKSPIYRFGSTRAEHGRGRAALNRATGSLKSLIEKIADAKVRRLQRELALHGVFFDASDQSWVTGSDQHSVRR